MNNNFNIVSHNNAHDNSFLSVTGCGLSPVHPLRSREKVPQKWAVYDREKKMHDACKGKKIDAKPLKKARNKAHRHEILYDVNRVNPGAVIVRGAYLSILNINLVGIATAFGFVKDAKGTHWKQITEKWKILGGDEGGLANAIEKGRDKKPLFQELLNKNKNKKHNASGNSDYNNANGENVGKIVAAASAGMGAITSILVAAAPETGGATTVPAAWTGAGTAVTASMAPILNSFAKENGATLSDLSTVPSVPVSDPNLDKDTLDALKENDATIFGIPETPFIIGVIILVSGVAITLGVIAYKRAH